MNKLTQAIRRFFTPNGLAIYLAKGAALRNDSHQPMGVSPGFLSPVTVANAKTANYGIEPIKDGPIRGGFSRKEQIWRRPTRPMSSGTFVFAIRTIVLASFLMLLPTSTSHAQIHDDKPLELSGYSLSQAYDIQDNIPLDLDDPAIIQLVYRVKKTSAKSRGDYVQYSKDVTWEQVLSNTQDYRLWVFDRHARLKKITKHRFAGADKDDPVKGVFVCHCENDQQQPLIVLSQTAPKLLPVDVSLDEPIVLNGFLYARRTMVPPEARDASDEQPNNSNRESEEFDSDANQADADPQGQPVFIVDRIAWYPEQVVEGRSNQSQIALAKSGVDIGLLDLVRENNARKLGNEDKEAFFQMIAGVNRIQPNTKIDKRIDFIEMMRNAKSNFGNAARIKAMVRSCSEINITDPDIVKRMGITKYYQLSVFPNLDGGKIIVKNKSGEDLEYRRFPITVCCLELPDGLDSKTVERKPYLIDGFFFRFWKYQSDKTDAAGASGQVSPLIIAKTLMPIDSQEGRLDFILLCFVSALIAGFAFLVWRYRNVDRRRQTPGQKIIETLPDQIDVSGIEEEL